MIRVTIELVSAISGRTSEIGRMYITNDGTGDSDVGDYDVGVCRRGTTAIPAECGGIATSARGGRVLSYPRRAYNVWRLISRAVMSAFPEERKTKAGRAYEDALTPEIIRGLKALVADGHPEPDEHMMAAYEWLMAAEQKLEEAS
mgnify:CR=1 FL=1